MGGSSSRPEAVDLTTLPATPKSGPRALPIELSGVHVTAVLASLPGKLDEYLDLEREGATALELDIKDENGEVGFVPNSVPLAVSSGATRDYYDARAVANRVRERGLYLVGRIVTFEDPVLSRARPDLAVQRSDGSVWRDAGRLGWTNPYDRRVWKYNVDLAIAAAHAGFAEIMFDYARFPSDGDVDAAVYRNRRGLSKREADSIAQDLLDGLGSLDQWPEKVRTMQANLIGRSEGLRFRFAPDRERRRDRRDRLFTTRPDTLFGASFLAIAPDHPLATTVAAGDADAAGFIAECNQVGTSATEVELAEKKGFKTALEVVHPFDSTWRLPVYIANFVLMDYGTGAIFGVPGHDQRDFEFAKRYHLPIRREKRYSLELDWV